MEDVVDSVKTWFRDRLKSPYFAAVAIVWLVINRVAVFGIFNFHEDQTLDERVNWIHNQLNYKSIWFFNGFEGILLFCFIMGFVTMLLYEYLQLAGQAVFHYGSRLAINTRAKMRPAEWRSISEVELLAKEYQQKIDDLDNGYRTLLNISNETSRKAAIADDEKKITLERLSLFEKQKADSDERLIKKSKADEKLISELTSEVVGLKTGIPNVVEQKKMTSFLTKLYAWPPLEDEEDNPFVLFMQDLSRRFDDNNNTITQKDYISFTKSKFFGPFVALAQALTINKKVNWDITDNYINLFTQMKLITRIGGSVELTEFGNALYQNFIDVTSIMNHSKHKIK